MEVCGPSCGQPLNHGAVIGVSQAYMKRDPIIVRILRCFGNPETTPFGDFGNAKVTIHISAAMLEFERWSVNARVQCRSMNCQSTQSYSSSCSVSIIRDCQMILASSYVDGIHIYLVPILHLDLVFSCLRWQMAANFIILCRQNDMTQIPNYAGLCITTVST